MKSHQLFQWGKILLILSLIMFIVISYEVADAHSSKSYKPTPIPIYSPDPKLPSQSAATAADDGSIIDVLVVYTAAARGTYTVPQMEANIRNQIASTNAVLRNSDVDLRIELVHMQEIGFVEPSNNSSASLNALTSSTATSGDSLSIAHQLRNTYHADLIFLLADITGGQANSAPFPSSERGYAVSPRDENGYNFEHEFAHLFAGKHEWYDDDAQTAPFTTYSHGQVDCTSKVVTMLSAGWECYNHYGNLVGDKVWVYSNPNLMLRGRPLGIAGGTNNSCTAGSSPAACDADNHRMINEGKASVAQYRASLVTWTGAVNNDWNTAGNWTINEGIPGSTTPVNRVPRPIDDVVIPSSGTPNIASGTANVRDLIIESGGSLTMSDGSLNVHGNFAVTGSFQATGGTVAMLRSIDKFAALQVAAGSFFNNLQIGNGTAMPWVKIQSDLDINGDVTLNLGSLLEAGNNFINVAGNWNNVSSTFDYGTSTVVFDGANQTISKGATATILNETFSQDIFPGGWLEITDTDQALRNARWSVVGSAATTYPFPVPGEPYTIRDSWFFTESFNFGQSGSYQLDFDYKVFNGNTDLQAHYGKGLLPSWTSSQIVSIPSISNTSFQTSSTTFSESISGSYNLGFRSYDAAPSTMMAEHAAIDNIKLQINPALAFYNLTINTGSTTILPSDLTVENTITNNGRLRQTKDTPASTATKFLEIKNLAGGTTKYYGVDIEPTSAVTGTMVEIRGNQTCGSDGTLGSTVQRCYEITPGGAMTADVTFYYRSAEANGNSSPNAYHYSGSGSVWDPALPSTGGGSGDGMWGKATSVSSYSPFSLADSLPSGDPTASCNAPAAVSDLAAGRTGTTVNLNWTGTGADTYEIHRKVNDPYFTPGAGTLITTIAGTSFPDPGKLGDPAMNYFYVVTAKNNCGGGLTAAPSNRVGEFDFGIFNGGPQTYTYDDEPAGGIAISSQACDGSEIVRTFNVGETFTVSDLNVGFNADHTYRGDIRLTLESPAGTIEQIVPDYIFDNYFNYDILLDGDSGGVLHNESDDITATPYYDRTVMQALLDNFNDEPGNGTWILKICDVFPNVDDGVYNRSRLEFSGN